MTIYGMVHVKSVDLRKNIYDQIKLDLAPSENQEFMDFNKWMSKQDYQ
jgi:hypothetical protein